MIGRAVVKQDFADNVTGFTTWEDVLSFRLFAGGWHVRKINRDRLLIIRSLWGVGYARLHTPGHVVRIFVRTGTSFHVDDIKIVGVACFSMG